MSLSANVVNYAVIINIYVCLCIFLPNGVSFHAAMVWACMTPCRRVYPILDGLEAMPERASGTGKSPKQDSFRVSVLTKTGVLII